MMEEISDELFKRGLERAKMLDPVIKDIKTFSNEGLNKYEILELIKNIKNFYFHAKLYWSKSYPIKIMRIPDCRAPLS